MSFGDLSPLLYTADVCDSLAVGGCPNVLGIDHCRFCEFRSRMYKSLRYLTKNNIRLLIKEKKLAIKQIFHYVNKVDTSCGGYQKQHSKNLSNSLNKFQAQNIRSKINHIFFL